MSWEKGTLLVMAISAFLLIGWDVIVAFFNDVPNEQDTESGIIKRWYTKEGIWGLAFGWGVLGGHFFMPSYTGVTVWGLSFLLLSAIGLTTFGVKFSKSLSQVKWRVALRAFGLLNAGILCGMFFWPQ